MYYKIENRKCEVYERLHELRTKEFQIENDNEVEVKRKVELEFDNFLGHLGQQNFRRVTQYLAFKFLEPEKVNLKIWSVSKSHDGFFEPNRRTKIGRDMSEFLLNGLKGSRYNKVFEILELQEYGRFTFPYVEIVKDLIVIFVSDNQEPKDENLIEITKREFNELLS